MSVITCVFITEYCSLGFAHIIPIIVHRGPANWENRKSRKMTTAKELDTSFRDIDCYFRVISAKEYVGSSKQLLSPP